MQIIVFPHDGGKDVETARAAVHTEDKTVTESRKHTAVDGCEHHVGHRRVGIERPCKVEKEGEDRGADDDVDRICLSHQLPRHEEQWDIIKEGLQSDRQPEEVVDNHRDTRRTAREEMRRNQEKVDCTACDQAAERNSGIAHDAVPEYAHVQIMCHLTYPPSFTRSLFGSSDTSISLEAMNAWF